MIEHNYFDMNMKNNKNKNKNKKYNSYVNNIKYIVTLG